jgi:hypothetical protein
MKQRTKKRTYRKIKRTHGKKTRGRNTRGKKSRGRNTHGKKTHRKKSGIIQHTQYGGSPWAWLIFASIMGLRIEYVDEDEMGHKRIKRLILPGGVIYEFLNWLAGLIPPSIGTTKESKKMIMSEDLREDMREGNFKKWFLQFLNLKYGNKYESVDIKYNDTMKNSKRDKDILTRQRSRNLDRQEFVKTERKRLRRKRRGQAPGTHAELRRKRLGQTPVEQNTPQKNTKKVSTHKNPYPKQHFYEAPNKN